MQTLNSFTLFEAYNVVHAFAEGRPVHVDGLIAADVEKLGVIATSLDRAGGSMRDLAENNLADALNLMGIGQEAIVRSAAHFVNVLEDLTIGSAGHEDLVFANQVLDGWMKIVSTVC
jgi:hypothetical protein